MTPTIDDIEAALPHVPAGLHCGDLTEPDERRAFAVTVHEIVVRAMKDAHPVIAATLQAVGEVMAHGGTVYTANDGHRLTLEWPQHRPGVDLSDANVDPVPVPPKNQDGRNNGVSSCVGYPPDIEWGVDEARVTWPAPTTPPLMTIGEASVLALYCTADERCRKFAHTKVLEEAGRWKGKAVCVDHDPRENAR